MIGLVAGALVPSAMSYFGTVVSGVGTMYAPGGVATTLQHVSAVFTTEAAPPSGAVAGAAASIGIGAAAAPAACVGTAAALGAATGIAATAAWSRKSGGSKSERNHDS